MHENFNTSRIREPACKRFRLLSKLREYVTLDAAFKIYEMMILPILTYNTMIKLVFTET